MGDFFKTVFSAIAVPLALFMGLGVIFVFFIYMDINFQPILNIILFLSPIWLPVALFNIVFEQWMYGVQEKFQFENGRSTLRIKPPQEVLKSPEAMESILTQIFNTNSPDNLMQTYLDGKHPLVTSLEIVSLGGEVRFYANVPTKKVKNQIEAQLYAQYPGIEVIEELIDYTAEIKEDSDEWETFTFHLGKKDDEVLPIKTYIDFGLDKQPKEELKFEPMSALIEHISRAKPHERIWIQFLLVPHVKKNFKNGYLKEEGTWEKRAAAKVNEIMGRDKTKAGIEETENRPVLTPGEKETIMAIERNVSKYAYVTAIRGMYITKAGKFDGEMIGHLLRGFAQFDLIGRNGIAPRWRTDVDYQFFQDRSGAKRRAMKKRELEYYKARFYTEADKKTKIDSPKIMSVEELATIYHIPGTSVVTPTLSRVENTRREPPANLPTGLF